MWGAVDHLAGPAQAWVFAVVEAAEQGAVVDAGAVGEGPVGDVVGFAPGWWSVAAVEQRLPTVSVDGYHGNGFPLSRKGNHRDWAAVRCSDLVHLRAAVDPSGVQYRVTLARL